MRLIINRDSGAVAINGKTYTLDMASVQPEIVTVEWNDDNGVIVYRDGRTTGMSDPMRFKQVIDAWHDVNNALRTR